jgi:hypothetical protein
LFIPPEIDGTGIVVETQIFASIAVARGKPTLIMDGLIHAQGIHKTLSRIFEIGMTSST